MTNEMIMLVNIDITILSIIISFSNFFYFFYLVMEKNQAAMSSSTVDSRPTAPPPSPTALPPTYEEAIAQSMAMTNPSLNAPPYPTVDTRLSITTPCK